MYKNPKFKWTMKVQGEVARESIVDFNTMADCYESMKEAAAEVAFNIVSDATYEDASAYQDEMGEYTTASIMVSENRIVVGGCVFEMVPVPQWTPKFEKNDIIVSSVDCVWARVCDVDEQRGEYVLALNTMGSPNKRIDGRYEDAWRKVGVWTAQ